MMFQGNTRHKHVSEADTRMTVFVSEGQEHVIACIGVHTTETSLDKNAAVLDGFIAGLEECSRRILAQ